MSIPDIRLTVSADPAGKVEADWLIALVPENEPTAGRLSELDAAVGGLLTRLAARADLTGKALDLVPLFAPVGVPAARILLVGIGKRADADFSVVHDAAAAAAKRACGKSVGRLAVLPPTAMPHLADEEALRAAVLGILRGCHGPGLYKSEPSRFAPSEIVVLAGEAQTAVHRGGVEGWAVGLARELVNLPAEELYPESFAERARAEAAAVGVECEVFDEARIAAERMGAVLGVARGSDRPPRLVVLRYRKGNGPLLGLVGKGVTFDSGGLSLKSTDQMVDMKCDMAGAATVLAAVTAMAALQIPANVIAVMPLVENMTGGRAMKLGDVLRARNGTTIEVLNTDAEGRLILADALSYVVDQGAARIVDLATLTGACMVALGTEVAGLFSNDAVWESEVLAAVKRAGEKAWPMPMSPHYDELLKTPAADLKNTPGTRYGGAIAAAKFLQRFVGTVPWAHLDIAGPAWAERESPARDWGGTGVYVRSLVELVVAVPQKLL